MRPLLTPEEMAAADKATIDAGTPVEVLMDRAGGAVARAAIRLLGGRYGKKVAVVCGKGNNGGDGYAAARVLKREGLGVRCLTTSDPAELKGAAREHHELAVKARVPVDAFDAKRLRAADLVVDAMFGTGFRGGVTGDAAAAIAAINDSELPVIAVDIPSGIDGLTGSVEGPAVEADVTVTMAAEKTGTALGKGAALAGAIEVADIGIPVEPSEAFVTEAADVAGVLPSRELDAHKRSAGSVALLVGSEGLSGAAVLAGRGAVRMGAGYATAGVTRGIEPVVSAALPEVLTKIVTDDDVLGPAALDELKPVLERADSLAIGPGLGRGDRQRDLVVAVLRDVELPVVIDADGLNVLAGETSSLVERERPVVLTPHPAELARLLETETAKVQSDRLSAARDAAARFGCVVLLKGFHSVVADPSGRAVVNPTGGSELATAGTGDVLTGAVAALLAAGVEPFDAAWAAAYVHGVAGDLVGPGAIAWDVAEALPDAIETITT